MRRPNRWLALRVLPRLLKFARRRHALDRNAIERVSDPAKLVRDHLNGWRIADGHIAPPPEPNEQPHQGDCSHESNTGADPDFSRELQIGRKRTHGKRPPGRGSLAHEQGATAATCSS